VSGEKDIPPLVWHFVNELSQRMGRSIETIHGSTMDTFKSYNWPRKCPRTPQYSTRLQCASAQARVPWERPQIFHRRRAL